MADLIKLRNMILANADQVISRTAVIDPREEKVVRVWDTELRDIPRYLTEQTSKAYTASATDYSSGAEVTEASTLEPHGFYSHVGGRTRAHLGAEGLTFYNSSSAQTGFLGTNINDYVISYGTTSDWVWRRWSSGVWEGWKTVSVTLSNSSGWAAWGNIFQSSTFAQQSLPVTLAANHYEFVTSHATQDWSSWAVILDPPTTTQTGSYILCRGTRPSDTAVFKLDYYVRGVVA